MPSRSEKRGTLHLACMPYPTVQGTQAIVGMMVRSLRDAGRRADLLTYAHGAEGPSLVDPLRLGDWPRVHDERSGPSLGKIALDLRMIRRVRAEVRSRSHEIVVAHNVEAAWVATAARVPFVYYAHTSMERELPFYAAQHHARAMTAAGALLDRGSALRALTVLTITPGLGRALLPFHDDVRVLPPPFDFPEGPRRSREERKAARATARRELGIRPQARVASYCGNLDGYQGVESLIEALARREDGDLLVATASDPTPLMRSAMRAGVAERVILMPLRGESDRQRAHAACDVALVPRRAPGGLPIKLLDALARGVPVVTVECALGGFPLPAGVHVLPDDDGDAWAAAWDVRAGDEPIAVDADTRARFSRDGFVDAIDDVLRTFSRRG